MHHQDFLLGRGNGNVDYGLWPMDWTVLSILVVYNHWTRRVECNGGME